MPPSTQAADEARRLEAAMLALEAQRGNLGDAVVDTALAPLRERLAALQAAPAPAETRLRQVTVLFADVVGSTEMAARLAADDVAAVMSRVLERFGAVVQAWHGRVARYTGDGLKALFGAVAGDAAADETAAECAVHAGLDIVAEAAALDVELRRSHGLQRLAVRVGINTGQVAIGGGIEAEDTAMGVAVSLASRLEQAALPGTVLISQATQAHVRGLFETEAQAPLQVKGYEDALLTHRVLRALPRAFRAANRGLAGVGTRLVGRVPELARLLAAADAVRAGRGLQAVTVFGEAGVGKSRLLHELQQQLAARDGGTRVLAARADPHRRMQPYGVLRELLAGHAGLGDGDGAEPARQRLCQALAPPLAAADAEAVGHLVGLDFSASARIKPLLSDARLLRDRAFAALLQWLRHLALQPGPPLLLLIDDLHWADGGTLDWLRRLLDADELPLLLLMLARPELHESRPGWAEGSGRHAGLQLLPLAGSAPGALADQLLARLDPVPPALHELLVHDAGGNPFYMEELVRMLIDDGVIVDDGARWRLAAPRLPVERVPQTLTAVLQARLEALAQAERQALQLAAVIGVVFWHTALQALDPEAARALPELERRQFVRRQRPSSFDDGEQYQFVHHLLYQVTYDTVLMPVRRRGHALVAAWLARRVQQRSGEHLAATASHYERAGDHAQAARYYARAADDACARYANDAALAHAAKALELLAPGDADADADGSREERFRLLQLRDRVFDVLGDRDAQVAVLDEMAALCGPGADAGRAPAEQRKAMDLAFRRAMLADRRGDFADARQHAERSAALAEALGAWPQAARAHGECAYVLMREGRHADAAERIAQADALARRGDDTLVQAQVLAIWGLVDEARQQPLQAIEHMQQTLALARAHGHVRLEGLVQGNLGEALLAVGDVQGAQAQLEASLQAMRAIGSPSGEANALGYLAEARLLLGDVPGALDAAAQAVALTTRLGDRYFHAQWLLRQADALAAAGRGGEALQALQDCGAQMEGAGAVPLRQEAAIRAAELALAGGDAAEARRRIAAVLEAGDADADTAIDTMGHPLRARCIVWRVLRAAGDPRAAAWLAQAQARLQAQAARLDDEAKRRRFLTALPWHRALTAAADG
ncbi:MAG: AAA family ATPase [Rubrivivax sp.]